MNTEDALAIVAGDMLLKVAPQLFDAGCIKDRSKSPGGNGFRLKLHEKNPRCSAVTGLPGLH